MAIVRKILEKTLTAGSTSISFTDSDIPNSLLRVYSSQASLFPISQTLSGNVLTVTYKAQPSNVGIALEIVKQGLDIVDNVVTEDATKALSANQGVVLKGLIDGLSIPDNITDLDDVSVSAIQNGQVLAWNSTSEKFENVNQSGGGSDIIYSTDERLIGSYFGENLYEKSFIVSSTVTMGDNYLITHDLTNIKKVIDIDGNYFDIADSRSYPLPNLRQTWKESVYITCFIPSNNTPIIALQSGGYNYGSVKDIVITVRYTKI